MINLQPYISETEELSATPDQPKKKLHELKRILERLSRELTNDEPIQFSNLFSRIVFVAQKYQLPKQLEWQLQHFRVKEKELRSEQEPEAGTHLFRSAVKAMTELFRFLQEGSTVTVQTAGAEDQVAGISSHTLRVHLLKIDNNKRELLCVAESTPGTELMLRYDLPHLGDNLTATEVPFREGAQLNLIDCEIDKEGYFIPRLIVLEPDYLIDASAIAECFQDYAITPLHYFRNKFETRENRSYLLLGNLANFFLDELVFAEKPDEVSFGDVFLRSFRQSPFEYTSCEDIRSDDDFRLFMQKAKRQFDHIRRVISDDFPVRAIDVHQCTLEPSFFSERFGFQGRLDLLHLPAGEAEAKIVELKSGRLPYPAYDSGRIALNHEVQTAVYRLMVESVFGKDARHVEAAILYSAGENPGENLRFAPVYRELEKMIIHVRNLIVANEQMIIQGDNGTVEELFSSLFNSILTERRLPDFYKVKIEDIRTVLSQCSDLEKTWFYRYIRFIARELYLQKIGDVEYESPTGLASLWNSDFNERAAALDLLYNLTISEIDDSGNDMTIFFSRNREDNDIVNFREGEICIVYPRQDENDTVLNRQILKGSIVCITREMVEVRFRYKQRNHRFFSENRLWAIEHDNMDSSYNNMYKSIYAFLNASKQKRELLLGLRAPGNLETTVGSEHETVSGRNNATTAGKEKETSSGSNNTTTVGVEHETMASPTAVAPIKEESDDLSPINQPDYPEDIIQKAMQAEDYFLIVGPPGTGKTSIFARRLIEEYHKRPDNNILVLAYTNRAVDELCEAINAAFGCDEGACDSYIRVGTELSCEEPYRHRLLQQISEKAKNRESLRQEIRQCRIYVSTLSSIQGRMELFALKHFHLAIIDEASQILEPQIIGLLPHFDKFIMIGDHNQLATIVLQKPSLSRIEEPLLREAAITDCSDSLFERLLRRCSAQGWHHAYVQLTLQGRMHDDIAAFPGKYFYSGGLLPAKEWQSEAWSLDHTSEDFFHRHVAAERTLFFSTERICGPTLSDKINGTEADTIVRLIQSIRTLYTANGKAFDSSTIGIITPYRNQIALIRHRLVEAGIDGMEKLMIDTVERFQGSQRDVIILSFCINKPYQMNFLCNPNHDGTVDRKLNVALTRARQQLFLVGNAAILRRHPVYATLLDHYQKKMVVLEQNEIIY